MVKYHSPKFVCKHCGKKSHAREDSEREKEELCPNCFNYQCHNCGGEGMYRIRNKTRYLNLCEKCDTDETAKNFYDIVTHADQYTEFLEKHSYHARTYKNYRKGL